MGDSPHMLTTHQPSQRRTREFTGPTPHSVAIQERKRDARPRDFLIQERQKKESERQLALDQKSTLETFSLKNEWEKRTNNVIRKNTIQRKVEGKLFEADLKLEERRNQLLSKLIEEEAEYARELEVHFRGESFIERQAKMRQRAKELADKRETERLKIVSEKNEQKWRQECVELRPVLSRRMQDQVCAARKHQIETYRRELERNRIQRLRRELKLKEEEQQLEKKILDEASRALNDEKTFTAELREQRIQYEQQYREYIRQLRLEEIERERQLDQRYTDDQSRDWELRDAKLRQQNEARQELMKRVYQIRADQIQYRENEKRKEIEADQCERQRILHDV